MTGADRTWASRYEVGDVLHYQRGSKDLNIERHSYAKVVTMDLKENLLTVEKPDGEHVTYNPARLRGISSYREIEREFAIGDRLIFTAPAKELGVANRDLATIESIGKNGQLSVRMDKGKAVTFDANEMRHLDHGYAVTSYSSQGLTAEHVLVNVDTQVHASLIDSRFAYVSISRAAQDAQIYTDAASVLSASLGQMITKTSAVTLEVAPGI
jgi:ATP-dependent exoDNAse (exonuclease V) alpha subunit